MIINPAIELSFDSLVNFPATGAENILYVATDTNSIYRWNGTAYVTVSAAALAAGNKGDIQFRGASAGVFDSAANNFLNWNESKKSLQVGSEPSASVADALITQAKNVNSYVQSILQNTNSNPNASTDFVAMNNLGTDDTNYVDLGMNSSNYSDPAYPLSMANDGYLYAENANVTIGTDTEGKYLLFHTGGFDLTSERIRIIDSALPKDALVKLSSHLQLLSDTTANRPTSPVNGTIRYNTTTNKFEAFESGTWKDVIGEINTGSNLGTGAQIFKQKTGVNFEFRTIKAGAGIALNQSTNEVEIINTATGTSAVIAYYFLNSQTPFVTSGLVDVAIPSMSIVPVAGTYHVKFNSDLLITQNGKKAIFSIYRGGVLIADSVRTTVAHGNNDDTTTNVFTVATFNGSQSMEIRVRTDSSSISVGNRAAFMEKLV